MDYQDYILFRKLEFEVLYGYLRVKLFVFTLPSGKLTNLMFVKKLHPIYPTIAGNTVAQTPA